LRASLRSAGHRSPRTAGWLHDRSVHDSEGATMIRVALLVLCVLASPAAAVTRYALVLGNDAGDSDEQRLRYAEQDAARFTATLTALGGFAPADVVVIRGGDAEAARAALIALNARIRQAGASDAMLVVYYSGHADAERLHLGTTSLPLAQLE